MPVPKCPSGDAEALVEALKDWVEEEAAAVRAAALPTRAVATAYADALARWAEAAAPDTRFAVPRVTKALLARAHAVGETASRRVQQAAVCYRTEIRTAREAAAGGRSVRRAVGSAVADARVATCREDVEAACEVRRGARRVPPPGPIGWRWGPCPATSACSQSPAPELVAGRRPAAVAGASSSRYTRDL